jgi:cysteine desulfurase/selenocysteine lyase
MSNMPTLDTARIRADFPILNTHENGRPLVFLDSAASSQKPRQVLEAMSRVYLESYANVHRGLYPLSARATALYDDARARVARFIGADSADEIVFTRNATEALNLLAYSYARSALVAGDEILVSALEHHANFVPWWHLAQERGVHVRVIPLQEDGQLDLTDLDTLLSRRTKIVSIAHVSNVLGTITDVHALTEAAHAVGAVMIVDACQSVPHMPVHVRELACDFLTFSGHKLLGPTGIGVLYGRRELLDRMPPFMTGGDMVLEVHLDKVTWNTPPLRFEAGTPAFVEAIGLAAAIDYLDALGMAAVRQHEVEITQYALSRLRQVPGLRVLGPQDAELRGGVAAFHLDGVHPHDLADFLGEQNVAVRAGFHCAQPVHDRFGGKPSTRASFYVYTETHEVDQLIASIDQACTLFRRKRTR